MTYFIILHFIIVDIFLTLTQKTGDKFDESLKFDVNPISLRLVFGIRVYVLILCPELRKQIMKVAL